MDENAYQSPFADQRQAVGVLSGKREDVRAVALYQNGILVCIWICLLCFLAIAGQMVGQFSVTGKSGDPHLPSLLFPLSSAAFLAEFAGLVFVFLLATKVYGTGLGILLAMLTFFPCIGLIVLLVVNGKATSVLKQNGHRVGLLGANLSEFRG